MSLISYMQRAVVSNILGHLSHFDIFQLWRNVRLNFIHFHFTHALIKVEFWIFYIGTEFFSSYGTFWIALLRAAAFTALGSTQKFPIDKLDHFFKPPCLHLEGYQDIGWFTWFEIHSIQDRPFYEAFHWFYSKKILLLGSPWLFVNDVNS